MVVWIREATKASEKWKKVVISCRIVETHFDDSVLSLLKFEPKPRKKINNTTDIFKQCSMLETKNNISSLAIIIIKKCDRSRQN